MKSERQIAATAEAKLKSAATFREKFGVFRTLQHAAFRLANKFFHFDCLHIIALDREALSPLDPGKTARLSTKVATREELREMQKQACWSINDKKLEQFEQGQICMLSYVDGKLAGYTWADASRSVPLVVGLTISVPDKYLYNFGAFTHPDFRGYSLQSFRHHSLLDDPRWRDKKGLLGFVVHTNLRSKRGQDKSGYRTIGKIYIIGKGNRLYAHFGKDLRELGIKRVRSAPPEVARATPSDHAAIVRGSAPGSVKL